MKRLAGEVVVLVAAIAVAVVVAQIVRPGQFPDSASVDFIAEKQRFYNRLFLATLVPLPAGIVAYWVLQKLYRRSRARIGGTNPTAR
jgi:hypothetical protein